MSHDHAHEFSEMAVQMQAEPTVDHTLSRVVTYAQETVSCDSAGVMLVQDRRLVTAVTTDPVVEKLDVLQLECGEGPCVESLWNHDSYVIDDTARDPRWPAWGPRVAELGVRSVLSVRLFEPTRTLGALNLYASGVGRFDADDVAVGHIFARHASVAQRTPSRRPRSSRPSTHGT